MLYKDELLLSLLLLLLLFFGKLGRYGIAGDQSIADIVWLNQQSFSVLFSYTSHQRVKNNTCWVPLVFRTTIYTVLANEREVKVYKTISWNIFGITTYFSLCWGQTLGIEHVKGFETNRRDSCKWHCSPFLPRTWM